MKAHRLALPILAAAVLLSTSAGVALAEEDGPADCGAAITAMNAADIAHRDAVADDEKAQKAKDADTELAKAEKRLTNATEKHAKVDADAKHDNPETAEDESVVTDAEQKAIDEAQALINTRTVERDAALVKAGKTDAAELQRKANRTDAVALQKTLDEAKADFDRLCIKDDDNDGDVEPTPEPAPVDPADTDDDFSQVGTVPSGAVQTGGWSS